MRPDASATQPRVLFYVQHLLGIGHLHRAARIAKALSSDGFRVRFVLGGPATPALDVGTAEVVQLPPVKAGPDGFAALVHADGRAFDDADAQARQDGLVACFDAFVPDVVLTEAFPFGRRQMRFELLPLLENARRRPGPPLIAASVRDILQRSKRPERIAETVGLVERFYDLVLVHGDPAMVGLGASFPEVAAFADKVAYTGIVAPRRPTGGTRPRSLGVVVSIGGGAVGAALIETALAARPLTRAADRPWLVITGPNLPERVVSALAAHPAGNVRFARFVPGLANLLSDADLSISQAGYNTVADILVAGCRSVLIPFAGSGETEQTDRAALMRARGLAETVSEADLTPAALAAAIDRALEQPRPSAAALDLDGAAATGRLLRSALAGRSHTRADADRQRRSRPG